MRKDEVRLRPFPFLGTLWGSVLRTNKRRLCFQHVRDAQPRDRTTAAINAGCRAPRSVLRFYRSISFRINHPALGSDLVGPPDRPLIDVSFLYDMDVDYRDARKIRR
jgi:hypothetical protein